MRRKLIAGNWKMNGLQEMGDALAAELSRRAAAAQRLSCEILICPPATLLARLGAVLGSGPVALGAQDCHWEPSGAFTGDIAAPMLAELGCRYVIVGHSERRQMHGEDDGTVRRKAEAAIASDIVPIVCVGESLVERESGQAEARVSAQLRGSLPASGEAVIAYEPVWAIGTGRSAQTGDVQEMHRVIRNVAAELRGGGFAAACRVLYGGSVKPNNAAELLALSDVDGALVGGASLKAEDFWPIVEACP